MAANCVLGFLVLLCYYFLLLLADYEECPVSFDCGKLGKDIHHPFTNTTNPKCGLAIRGCDDPAADKEILLEDNQIWYKIERILQYDYNLIVIRYPNGKNFKNPKVLILQMYNFSLFDIV